MYSLLGFLFLWTHELFMMYFIRKKYYWLLPNNKEKMHSAIIQNKDTKKHTKNPHFSLASSVFQCCGRCLHGTDIYYNPSLCAYAIFGRYNLCLLRHSSVLFFNLLLPTVGQKLSNYQPLVNLLPQVPGRSLLLAMFISNWECTTTIQTNVNVMRS